ncbi:hypothetical protein DPMN_099361 [Dreissena polymorpha]|uniref:Uncharacterized protein n=1 Tax=Dreissena polymorpha TaxID=45954 RepID=A0A9D4LGB1_DREPO|nr:hypothetical protein DPMN_099361 [Dreissena polymorpha]
MSLVEALHMADNKMAMVQLVLVILTVDQIKDVDPTMDRAKVSTSGILGMDNMVHMISMAMQTVMDRSPTVGLNIGVVTEEVNRGVKPGKINMGVQTGEMRAGKNKGILNGMIKVDITTGEVRVDRLTDRTLQEATGMIPQMSSCRKLCHQSCGTMRISLTSICSKAVLYMWMKFSIKFPSYETIHKKMLSVLWIAMTNSVSPCNLTAKVAD